MAIPLNSFGLWQKVFIVDLHSYWVKCELGHAACIVASLFLAVTLWMFGCGLQDSSAQALHRAVQAGNTQAARRSLEAGADANSRDAVGRPALYTAASYGYADIVNLLLSKGAQQNVRYGLKDASTPLLVAARKGHLGIVRSLIRHGAAVTAANDSGMTALHLAAWGRHADVVKFLLEQGADPNAADSMGNTPLHSRNAYEPHYNEGYLSVVEALVSSGAKVSKPNKFGKVALYDAVMLNNVDVVEFLISQGADATVGSEHYYSPLEAARKWATPEIVQIVESSVGEAAKDGRK